MAGIQYGRAVDAVIADDSSLQVNILAATGDQYAIWIINIQSSDTVKVSAAEVAKAHAALTILGGAGNVDVMVCT